MNRNVSCSSGRPPRASRLAESQVRVGMSRISDESMSEKRHDELMVLSIFLVCRSKARQRPHRRTVRTEAGLLLRRFTTQRHHVVAQRGAVRSERKRSNKLGNKSESKKTHPHASRGIADAQGSDHGLDPTVAQQTEMSTCRAQVLQRQRLRQGYQQLVTGDVERHVLQQPDAHDGQCQEVRHEGQGGAVA